ncbi:MAG: hypothetical protein KatS3mg026_0105 [Bacteroidia bacterium]|nr:MAG: hypothetical protein KatS3mg026_0105 [Bacteroidia bacterium]
MSLARYRAQWLLPAWDQERLLQSTALVVGVGGLGVPAALYLAAMGLGHLVLVDPDTVAEENLHRQPLYTPPDVGQPKVEVLARYLQRFRPDLRLTLHARWADETFLRETGQGADIWLDGTDNAPSRLAIDAAAQALGKPWVYGAIFQWEGQAALLEGVSYRAFFGEGTTGPSCSEAGVAGAVPGIIGSLQAALAARYLTDPAHAPKNRLFRIDLATGLWESYTLASSLLAAAPPPVGPPLELSLQAAQQIPSLEWIDLREEGPPLPYPAHRWPWYQWDSWRLPDRPLLLVCQQGRQSRQIAFALRKKTGRTDIYSLQGGAAALLASQKGPST